MAKKTTATVDRDETETNGNGSKPQAPITREEFIEGAKPVAVTIAGMPGAAIPKEFKTGSFGWNMNTKATIEVDGVQVPVQVGLNLTVIGSKPPKD